MFTTSIILIKKQMPGITLAHLLHFYKAELHRQQVSNVTTNGDTLYFSNNNFKFVIDRYANKFSSFSSGQIKIHDNENEFIIKLEAKMTRLFISAAIIAGIITVLMLFDSGFTAFPFIAGIVVFTLLTIAGYLITVISFPVYFVALRNKLQQELTAMRQ